MEDPDQMKRKKRIYVKPLKCPKFEALVAKNVIEEVIGPNGHDYYTYKMHLITWLPIRMKGKKVKYMRQPIRSWAKIADYAELRTVKPLFRKNCLESIVGLIQNSYEKEKAIVAVYCARTKEYVSEKEDLLTERIGIEIKEANSGKVRN
jgi:hypothetical protein